MNHYTTPEGSAPKPQQQQVERTEAHTPEEDDDTLKSHSYARIVDLICEGPIAGFCNRGGRIIGTIGNLGKAVYLDETPIQNPNAAKNFKGVTLGCQLGTQDQDALAGFGKAEDVIYRGIEVTKAIPVVTSITNTDAERIEVAVRMPSMLEQDEKSGDVHGSRVEWDVHISLNGGAYFLAQHVLISGKSSGPYVHTTSHVLPQGATPGENNWSVKITRTTIDAPSLKTSNATFLEYITIVTRNKYAYPNSVLLAAEIDAKGFGSVPNRGYHIKGLLVKVPNNYFPRDRDQAALYNRDPITGDPVVDGGGDPVEQVWNGGFYLAWTDNPVWCFYDLITNTRYGLGDYMPQARVDKWTLYSAARYCDELVDDGYGHQEPRFSCNCYIQSREEAWKVVQDFASIFRGMAYYAGGVVQIAQDRPKDPVVLFTNGNVVEGAFSYAGTSKKARHTVVAVRWIDSKDFYRPKSEYVEDPDAIERYGINQIDLAAFACTSRGQARRMGKWVLITELYETDTINFRAGIEAAYLRPGDIIQVMDNNRAGAPLGGRLLAIASDRLSVTLDREVTIPSGVTTIDISRGRANLNPDQVTDEDDIDSLRTEQLDTHTITNTPGTTNVITFGSAISAAITLASVFIIQTAAVAPQEFRVVSVEELEAGEQYQVVGLEFRDDKFAAIEGDTMDLEEEDITELKTDVGIVPYVNNLLLVQNAIVRPTGAELVIEASWEEPPDYLIDHYIVEVKVDDPGEPWRVVETTSVLHSRILYSLPGTYNVGVTAVNGYGVKSQRVIEQLVIEDINPFDLYSITGLELTGQGNDTEFIGRDARFEWRLNSPANAQEFGSPVITSGQDPLFKDYIVIIRDTGGDEIYRETVLNPFFVFTYVKNTEAAGGPRTTFKIEVRGRDRYNNLTDPAILTVSNPAPPAPSGFTATSSFKAAYLHWVEPTSVFDIDAYLIYESAGSNDFNNATLIGEVGFGTTGFSREGMTSGTAYYFWIKARDTFGTLSTRHPAGGGVGTTPGTVETTDLADFAVAVTKMFTNTIALQSDQWTNNSPAAGRLAWNGHNIVFRGVITAITAGNTPTVNDKWIWWRGPIYTGGSITTPAETVYRTATAHPKDAGLMLENDFIIATNTAGAVDLAWRAIANALIGSASIRDLAVTNAKIADLNVDKLLAGTITSKVIKIAGESGTVESDNFVTGTTGWQIKGDGAAEFSDVTVRGTVAAGTILTDAKLATADYPTRNVLAAATDFVGGPSFDHKWAASIAFGSIPTAISIDGAAAAVVDVRLTNGCTFYGPGYPSSSAAIDAKRLATVNVKLFYWLHYTQSGSGGKVSLLYRKIPTGTVPDNDDLSHPWKLDAAGSNWTDFGTSPRFGFMDNITLADDERLQVCVCPIDGTATGTTSTDVLTDNKLVMMAINF